MVGFMNKEGMNNNCFSHAQESVTRNTPTQTPSTRPNNPPISPPKPAPTVFSNPSGRPPSPAPSSPTLSHPYSSPLSGPLPNPTKLCFTRPGLVAKLRSAFTKLPPVRTAHDIPAILDLIVLITKSRGLMAQFFPNDTVLYTQVADMALAKLPTQLVDRFKKHLNMRTLMEFVQAALADACKRTRYDPAAYCTHCNASGHRLECCVNHSSVICKKCFQFGHSTQCKNVVVTLEELARTIDL